MESTIIEIPLDQKTLTLLQAKAEADGQPVEQVTRSIIKEWAEEQKNNAQKISTNNTKMSWTEFIARCQQLKEQIRQRGVEDTGDSVEILREIREERSNR